MNTDFGLIGFPLSQSFSKVVHEKLGYSYSLNPIEYKNLKEFFHNRNFKGINVTIPYKEKVIDFLDEIDPIARKIGAVNTVINRNGKLIGYNTDYYGLISLIKKSKISLKNKKVLICGTGGTSKTALHVARDLGANDIIRVSRYANSSSNRISSGSYKYPEYDLAYYKEHYHDFDNESNFFTGICNYDEAYTFHDDADIIINATPCGMFPDFIDEEIINLHSFKKLSGVIDVVYNPIRTKLILSAESLNIPHASGLYMLVMQAIKSSELFNENFTNFEFSDELNIPEYFTRFNFQENIKVHDNIEYIRNQKITENTEFAEYIYIKILSEKQNIVLTGMPSSGKTTIGKELAAKLHRNFFDIDEIIEEKTGRKITDIFKFSGENAFRNIEKETIKSLRNITGSVVSTGGGSILQEENILNLKHNGKVFFMDVPIEMLVSSENRPLSSNMDMMKNLYDERISIYRETADVIVNIKRIEDRNSEYLLKFIKQIY